MRLPEELLAAIQREVENIDRRALVRSSAELTRRYRAADFSAPPIRNQQHRAAYLTARLPATFAANWRVFAEIRERAPDIAISSFLDLAAGPGTALFAAAEVFPALQQATLMESDSAWIEIGQRLAAGHSLAGLRRAEWRCCDLRTPFECSSHDLVVMSYALGELPKSAAEALLSRAWRLAKQFLVVIEPGTMRGFDVVHSVRTFLLTQNAGILAPCPHRNACPMAGTRDWCHFVQRLERSSAHRQAKTGSLGYEDEKFSYVAASREIFPPPAARIVRHPRKHGGHVELTLCAGGGSRIETRTVARSEGAIYRLARQSEWGDAWTE
ncbi:MAG TPA: small ribosomal subunit Rsm22 family protein [Candidatus Angelobacter sp.]|nr:small ribosomal subunit Rsm22 family protein [Candidatus Angelobacter sp.]